MRYSDPEHTVIQDGFRLIPTDPENVDYVKILESGVAIDDWVAPEKSWAEIRAERNARLLACDWMATSDRVLTVAQSTYRQALRDVPQDFADDPASVVWPTPPPS